MEKRQVKPGLTISTLGFGCSPLGHEFGTIDEEEGITAVRTAIQLGINYFDTSPYYGRGKSEEVLGRALKGIPRDSIVVSSKVGRYDVSVFDFSADRVTRSVDESLQRLGLDYLDIVFCHDIEFGNLDQIVQETIPALKKLKESGKIRFIGISGLPLHIFEYVLARTDDVDVILSYCHYTLLDDSLLELRELIEKKGVAVINASPLAMGLLTHAGPPSWHPAPERVKKASQQAVLWCAERSLDISSIALKYSVGCPIVSSTLVGMHSRELLRKNIEAVQQSMDEKVLQELKQILSPVHNVTWLSGKIENNGTKIQEYL